MLEGSVNTEVDKSVTSFSVVINEEHANLCLSDEELELISKDEVITLYHRLQNYIDELKRKQQDELRQAKEIEAKLRAERTDLSRREKVLIMRLTMRERQLVESEKETAILKSSIVPSLGALRSTLLDPAVNLIIEKLKKDLTETKKKLEETQNDLTAWKFTPDSNTGKRLMAKCRMLYMENEDLGKQTSSGRIAKLENDLALNKQLVTEMKQTQAETDDVLADLDEDIEGLQSAIQHLQQQLRIANERNAAASEHFPLASSSKSELNATLSELNDLSVVCAQCRSTLTLTKNQHEADKPPESTAIRTRNPTSNIGGELNERTTVEQPKAPHGVGGGQENDERTSVVNGEFNTGHFNYLQSVQNVVNSSNSSSFEETHLKQERGELKCGSRSSSDDDEDDGLIDSPPLKKKPKTGLTYTNAGELKTKVQNRECHNRNRMNGNGSIVDH